MFTITDQKVLEIAKFINRFIELSIREVEAQLTQGFGDGDEGHQEFLDNAPVHEIAGILIDRNA